MWFVIDRSWAGEGEGYARFAIEKSAHEATTIALRSASVMSVLVHSWDFVSLEIPDLPRKK